MRGRKESGSEEDDRGRRERGSEEDDGKEGGREVMRKWMERNEGVVRIERKEGERQ